MKSNSQPFSEHLFEYRNTEKKKLILSLAITLMVMAVELVGGLLTNSIALISDAGHMFTHAFAIGISLAAILIARKPLCHHRTFGLFRAEILAAFVNGIFLLVVAGVIVYESVERLLHPQEVLGIEMMSIAFIGLITNVVSILILRGSHKEDMNIRSVFFHMIADAASSVGIIVAALIILFTGWHFLDPLVSIGISVLILVWAWRILKESAVILLEMAPSGLNVEMIAEDLKHRFNDINHIENDHLWAITSNMLVYTAHVHVLDWKDSYSDCEDLLKQVRSYLHETYGILESTIQMCRCECEDQERSKPK